MCVPGVLGHHRAMETDLLEELWGRVTATVTALDEAAYDVRTRAAGWCVRDLVFHQLLDAQRALVALASPTEDAADVDAVSYWAPFDPAAGDGGRGHAAFVCAAAAAYLTGAVLAGQWRETSRAAVRAARTADPRTRVRTQGHVLTVADLVSTLVVEATVHLLDLTVELPDAPAPRQRRCGTPAACSRRRTAARCRPRWDDTEAVLRGTGRLPADDPRLPLLG